MTQIAKIQQTDISKIIETSGVDITAANQVTGNYQKFFIELAEIQEKAGKIDFNNPSVIDEKIARELRLATVKVRTSAETLKDERKKTYLLRGNLEQSVYNLIKDGCKVTEDVFFQVEKARELAEKKRKELLKIERSEKLSKYVDNTEIYPLSEMSEKDFESLLIGMQAALEVRIKAEKEAEQKRLAEIEAEKQKQIAIQKENERLKKEAIEREKIAAAEQKRLADVLAKQQKEAAEKARVEAEKQAKIQAELKEKARVEAEKVAKLEAEKKAELLRVENERKAKELQEKKAKAAPDRDKLTALKSKIDSFELPTLSSDEGIQTISDVKGLFSKISAFISQRIEKM